MNLTAVKARWLGALVAAGVLLVAGAGTAGARTTDGDEGPVRGVPQTVQLKLPPKSVAVSPDGRKAYVSVGHTTSGARLDVVDTQSGAVTAEVVLNPGFEISVGQVAVSPDGSRVYVLYGLGRHLQLSMLAVLDTATNTVIAKVAAPDQPRPDPERTTTGRLSALAVSDDGSRVFVAQEGPKRPNRPIQEGARILQFSAWDLTYTAAVTVPGKYTGGVAVRPGGGDAYISTDEGLSLLDTSGDTPVLEKTLADRDGWLAGLAVSPDGSRLYQVHTGGAGTVVDLSTSTVDSTFTVESGASRWSLALSDDGSRLYSVAQNSKVLSIDTDTNAVVPGEGVTGLSGAAGLALGPDGHTFYVVSGAGLQIIGH
ncbi:YncE family protein [Kitasatospora sp. NPDC101183]|uniref:YncE family protein n=1 Tax=Kitasatospora sp. NPDC101183 TaxID=3364100 RepID=UPI00380920B0